jgi:formylmethanofuran dehydrogenase subunit E
VKIVPEHDYQVGKKEFWICLKNKTPVRTTMMNIHQIVENSRYLENLVLEQGKQLLKQAEEMNELKALVKTMLTFDQQLFEKNDDCFSVTDSESETSSNKRVFNSCDLCGNE